MAAIGLVALFIALFIINLRRTGERARRVAERLETLERNDAIHRETLDAATRHSRIRDDPLDRLREGRF